MPSTGVVREKTTSVIPRRRINRRKPGSVRVNIRARQRKRQPIKVKAEEPASKKDISLPTHNFVANNRRKNEQSRSRQRVLTRDRQNKIGRNVQSTGSSEFKSFPVKDSNNVNSVNVLPVPAQPVVPEQPSSPNTTPKSNTVPPTLPTFATTPIDATSNTAFAVPNHNFLQFDRQFGGAVPFNSNIRQAGSIKPNRRTFGERIQFIQPPTFNIFGQFRTNPTLFPTQQSVANVQIPNEATNSQQLPVITSQRFPTNP